MTVRGAGLSRLWPERGWPVASTGAEASESGSALENLIRATFAQQNPIQEDVKVAVADDVLPDGTRIPAGAAVAWLPWCMGRLDALWPRPLEFDPERFLGATQPSPFLFTAFNAGPRTCLGQHLATVEGAAVLATLHREFEFELVPGQHIDYAESLTLPMKNGMRVYVRRRPA